MTDARQMDRLIASLRERDRISGGVPVEANLTLPAIEEHVLAVIAFQDPNLYEVAARQLTPDDFFFEDYSNWFALMEHLWAKGIPPSFHALSYAVGDIKVKSKHYPVGDRLMELMNAAERKVFSPDNFEGYCAQIREMAQRRELLVAASRVMDLAEAEHCPVELAYQCAIALFRRGGGAGFKADSIRPAGELVIDHIDKIKQRLEQGLPPETQWDSGIDELNDFHRGIQPEDLWVWVAGFNMGKTKQMAAAACASAMAGARCGLVSLDMGQANLVDYLAVSMHNTWSAEHPITWRDVVHAQGDSMGVARLDGVIASASQYGEGLLLYEDFEMDLLKLRSVCEEFAKRGVRIVYIDQAECFREFRDAIQKQNREAIGGMVRGIKEIAKELKIGIVLLHQATRDGVKEGRLTARSAAQSDSFGRQADFVLTIFDEQQWYCDHPDFKGYDLNADGHAVKPKHKDAPQHTRPHDTRPLEIRVTKTRRGGRSEFALRFNFATGVRARRRLAVKSRGDADG